MAGLKESNGKARLVGINHRRSGSREHRGSASSLWPAVRTFAARAQRPDGLYRPWRPVHQFIGKPRSASRSSSPFWPRRGRQGEGQAAARGGGRRDPARAGSGIQGSVGQPGSNRGSRAPRQSSRDPHRAIQPLPNAAIFPAAHLASTRRLNRQL